MSPGFQELIEAYSNRLDRDLLAAYPTMGGRLFFIRLRQLFRAPSDLPHWAPEKHSAEYVALFLFILSFSTMYFAWRSALEARTGVLTIVVIDLVVMSAALYLLLFPSDKELRNSRQQLEEQLPLAMEAWEADQARNASEVETEKVEVKKVEVKKEEQASAVAIRDASAPKNPPEMKRVQSSQPAAISPDDLFEAMVEHVKELMENVPLSPDRYAYVGDIAYELVFKDDPPFTDAQAKALAAEYSKLGLRWKKCVWNGHNCVIVKAPPHQLSQFCCNLSTCWNSIRDRVGYRGLFHRVTNRYEPERSDSGLDRSFFCRQEWLELVAFIDANYEASE